METVIGKVDYKLVPKGWGYEKIFWNDDKYCGKLLFIAKARKCSWHYHNIKDETFYIQKGEVYVFFGSNDDPFYAKNVILKQGDVFHVPPGLRHQMQAVTDTYLFEFSTHDEDSDSIRVIKGD